MGKNPESRHTDWQEERRQLLKTLFGTAFAVPLMTTISPERLDLSDLSDGFIPVTGRKATKKKATKKKATKKAAKKSAKKSGKKGSRSRHRGRHHHNKRKETEI